MNGSGFRLAVIAALALALRSGSPALAQEIAITSCGDAVSGKGAVGVLQNDIDCIAAGMATLAIVMGDRTTLDLNGFAVRSAVAGIDCAGKCEIVGPGTITTDGLACGIQVAQNTKARLTISSVEIHDNAVGICGGSPKFVKLRLDDVTVRDSVTVGIGGATFRTGKLRGAGLTVIDNGAQGIAADKVRLDGSTIQNNGQSGVFAKTAKLTDTAVSGSLGAPDLATAKRPRLKGTSTCGTSVQLTQYPAATFGSDWDTCSGD